MYVDPNSKFGKGLLVIGVPLFGLMLGFLVFNWYRAARSLWWPSVTGMITQSSIGKVVTMHGSHDKADIKYSYFVGGKHFQNDTIAFSPCRGIFSWGQAERDVKQFPLAEPVQVFYDPASPDVSCLLRGGLAWQDILLLVLCVAGIRMGWKQIRTILRRFGPEGAEPRRT